MYDVLGSNNHKVSDTFYVLHPKKYVRLVAGIDQSKQSSENVCIQMYQLVRGRSVISSNSVHQGHRKLSHRLTHRLF